MKQRTYIAIDLKSFYASVECRERGLDPLDTNLVVADESRTDKTVCLAVTPPLKEYGIAGRGRLFEVKRRIRDLNAARRVVAPGGKLTGFSCFSSELRAHPSLAIDFLVAPPRMAYYMEYSTRIYQVYMKYVAPEDVIVYSIDEVFMDVTDYLDTYRLSARGLAVKIIRDVLETTGITATAGIGSNLYLAKVAMDIVAKHIPADQNGVRIAELDEGSYRRTLWTHRPLTDFWRVGHGYARKLEENGMYTMGDVARRSVSDEAQLYRLFGKNAELLIDHAWGWEPCTVADVKAYRPADHSMGSGQVLHCPYEADKARLVLREMADALSLSLVERGLVTDQISIGIGYEAWGAGDPGQDMPESTATDRYGRRIPKGTQGAVSLGRYTSSAKRISDAAAELFDRIVNRNQPVRRLNIVACRVLKEEQAPQPGDCEQLDLFTDYTVLEEKRRQEDAELAREKKVQQTLLTIKKKYGKNAILKGMNLEEGATGKDRNDQIGGHKA